MNSSKGKDVFTIKLNSTSLTTALTTISNIAIGKKTLILPLSIETPTNISKKGKTYKFDIILKIKDNKITIPVEFLVKGTEPVVDKEKINTTEENNTLNKVLDTIKSMNLTNTTVVDGNNIDLLVNNISKVSPENATPVIVAVSENITPSIENASVKVTSKSETSGYTTYNKKVVNITVNISFENKTNSLVVVAIPLGDYGITDVIKNGNSIPKDTPKNGTHYEITTINGKKVILLYLKDDPVITLVAEKTVSSLYNPPSGGGHHVTVTTKYPDVAQDIKSEKIKEIVHNYKLILGSEIDNNMSAKHLKNTSELINKPLEIKEDCILIGGPVANPLVKKFLWTFPVKVTNNYPGAHKGVIQKQIINGHNVILLAGSDRYGTKAAVEYFKTLDDIPSEPIFVEWKDNKAIKINKP
ncbi:S-layer protein [Methanothermococcus okinawensis]|uniref:S-layer family protein n=1 Tax=Methanothermococcus okinawensis (strain DSM 14208 / JCM 11175 / IH1) TaxID=647113 RepID=F8AL37_METOI|nr:S-layer protein [Methanothermococcus okinawensis]AEH06473.1 S-layer family protein [Methanothermococcus okinawensis IH1]